MAFIMLTMCIGMMCSITINNAYKYALKMFK